MIIKSFTTCVISKSIPTMEINVEKYVDDNFIAGIIGVGSVPLAHCIFDRLDEALEAAAVTLVHLMLTSTVHADNNIINKILNDFYPSNVDKAVYIFETSKAIEFFVKNGYEEYLEKSALEFKNM